MCSSDLHQRRKFYQVRGLPRPGARSWPRFADQRRRILEAPAQPDPARVSPRKHPELCVRDDRRRCPDAGFVEERGRAEHSRRVDAGDPGDRRAVSFWSGGHRCRGAGRQGHGSGDGAIRKQRKPGHAVSVRYSTSFRTSRTARNSSARFVSTCGFCAIR